MPYFVYKITGARTLEHLDTFPKYRDARLRVRALRAEAAETGDGGGATYRMVFARHAEEAERLLTQKREPRPLGEDV